MSKHRLSGIPFIDRIRAKSAIAKAKKKIEKIRPIVEKVRSLVDHARDKAAGTDRASIINDADEVESHLNNVLCNRGGGGGGGGGGAVEDPCDKVRLTCREALAPKGDKGRGPVKSALKKEYEDCVKKSDCPPAKPK